MSLACAAAPRHQRLHLALAQRCTSRWPSERALPHQAAAVIKRLLHQQGLRLRRFQAPALLQTPALEPTSSITLCYSPSAQIRCVAPGLARGRCRNFIELRYAARQKRTNKNYADGVLEVAADCSCTLLDEVGFHLDV